MEFRAGDKVVMDRTGVPYRMRSELFDSERPSWWREMENLEPLTVRSVFHGSTMVELEFVETPLTAMNEWVMPYNG